MSEHACFGCGASIPDEPGMTYCDQCIARQLQDQGDEREAYDAYHAWIDQVTRGAS